MEYLGRDQDAAGDGRRGPQRTLGFDAVLYFSNVKPQQPATAAWCRSRRSIDPSLNQPLNRVVLHRPFKSKNRLTEGAYDTLDIPLSPLAQRSKRTKLFHDRRPLGMARGRRLGKGSQLGRKLYSTLSSCRKHQNVNKYPGSFCIGGA